MGCRLLQPVSSSEAAHDFWSAAEKLPQVCQFGNATCGGFTAVNDHGYLQVSLQNTGVISAAFTVTVSGTRQRGTAVEPFSKSRHKAIPPACLSCLCFCA